MESPTPSEALLGLLNNLSNTPYGGGGSEDQD